MAERPFPDAVKKLIRKKYRGPDDCWLIRKLLRRHYKEWADIPDAAIARIARSWHPPSDDKPPPPTNRPISLAGPIWSWPEKQQKEYFNEHHSTDDPRQREQGHR